MGVIAYHGVGLPRLESLALGDYAFNTGRIAVFASWSCFGVLSKGLSRLQSATFGVESFRGCVNAVFESWLLLRSVIQRLVKIAVSDVWCGVVP